MHSPGDDSRERPWRKSHAEERVGEALRAREQRGRQFFQHAGELKQDTSTQRASASMCMF